jgi:hypothetical protein
MKLLEIRVLYRSDMCCIMFINLLSGNMICDQISFLFSLHQQMFTHLNKSKGKAIPVTGRGGKYGCETSRLPRFLDNLLTDGGEAVSLTRRPAFL